MQVGVHLEDHNILDLYRFFCYPEHGTENALVEIWDELLLSAIHEKLSLLLGPVGCIYYCQPYSLAGEKTDSAVVRFYF